MVSRNLKNIVKKNGPTKLEFTQLYTEPRQKIIFILSPAVASL